MKTIIPLLAAIAGSMIAHAAIDPISDETKFDEIGICRSGFIDKSGATHLFRDGDRGGYDEATGATVNPDSRHRGKTGVFMHPPYKDASAGGFALQEFTIRLPASPAAAIEGFTALGEGAEQSDGVTYRVRVNGGIAWQDHRRGSDWQPFRADLTKWAGQTATIRFESAPGPKNDTGWDHSLWGERELLLPGYHAGSDHPAPPPLELRKLSSRQNQSWAPLNAFDGNTSVKLAGDVAQLLYRGRDGELTFVWNLPVATNAPPLGTFRLSAKMTGDHETEIPLVSNAEIVWTNSVIPVETKSRTHGGTINVTRTFRNAAGGIATLGISAKLEQKNLVLDFSCDKPWIRELFSGNWGPVAFRKKIPMPYYGHEIDFLPAENIFVSSFPDWSASNASIYQNDRRAKYDALTDGSRNMLRERFVFSAAWHVDEVMANIPNPPSPWRDYFGKRIVLDIWNGDFAGCAKSLDEMSKFDVRDDYIIYHCWQRDGYDNGLPAHFPACGKQGGEAQMNILSATAKRLGHRFSLHENYVDYYPNYEHFTTHDISLRSDGSPETAWYNEGTKVQSFAEKPGAILRLAHEQSPEIHQRYGTTAGYLDVHSCVPLWFHVDHRAGEPDAGSLQAVWKVHRELWQFERDTHGGPETGEGNGHWPWSGLLDGVEAQFGTGWSGGEGLTAPLLVDFNLLRVHPLQMNHGQGYYERWYGHPTPWGEGVPVAVFDQYRMQEIAFGHSGFLSHDYWRKPNIAWLEQHLVPPVSSRHATQQIHDIAYHIDGNWFDTTEATKRGLAAKLAPMENFGRIRIVYENGLTIIANSVANDFTTGDWTLPQFGWIATDKNFAAGTVRRDGVTVDFVDSPDYQFGNARRARDWNTGAPLPVSRQNVNLAEKEIDFGFVKTSGSVLRKREHGEWKQWTYPAPADFHMEFLPQRSINPAVKSGACNQTVSPGSAFLPALVCALPEP